VAIGALDGQQAVIYKGLKHYPTLGRNFETMDRLNGWREWRITSGPGKHRTLSYSYYANRVRGEIPSVSTTTA
jgi:hypothetical protein